MFLIIIGVIVSYVVALAVPVSIILGMFLFYQMGRMDAVYDIAIKRLERTQKDIRDRQKDLQEAK